MNKSKSLIILFFICSSISVQAQEFKTQTGKIEFLSEATVESFTGTSSNLNGLLNVADSTLDFYLDLSTLTTGIKLRDEHMRENHLETEDFPFAEFSGKIHGFDAAKSDTQLVKAKGNFTIHGVTNAIEVDGKLIKQGSKISIIAKFGVKLDDYKIKRPEFLFLKLSPEQKVTVTVDLINEK